MGDPQSQGEWCYHAFPSPPALLKDWTETYVRWSPMGTYLATLHSQGVALWGGDDYKRIAKFAHPGVQYIDFSPCERYEFSFRLCVQFL